MYYSYVINCMARTAQIHYQRVTFSLPKKVVEDLRKKVGQNNMSSYVAGLIEEDLDGIKLNAKKIVDSMKIFRDQLEYKDDRSSLEILRSIRYDGKH